MRIAIAIHDAVWTLPPTERQRIAAALPEDSIRHVERPSDRLAVLRDAEVLFAHRITVEEFAACRSLRWIHSPSAGVGGLLNDAVVNSHVMVTNSRGVHSAAIAEHAVALTLALRRQLHIAVRRQSEHAWAQEELSRASHTPIANGAAMLVIGLGTIGARIAQMAASIGFTVTGMRRRTDAPAPPGVRQVVDPSSLLRVLPTVDVIVVAAPATSDTRHLIGRSELAACKQTALLINVARGELVDEGALLSALQEHRIAGAALDAFLQEPLPPGHPLWDAPNVLITPHTAAFGGPFWAPLVDLFLENVARFKSGAPLRNVVDRRAGY